MTVSGEFRNGEKSSLPLWQKMVLLGAGYFACAWLGRFLSGGGGTLVSYWLPGGLFVAVLLLNDTREWPWLMASIVPANGLFDYLHDQPSPQYSLILLFCAANILQAAAGAWLVRRFVVERPTLASLKEFSGLMFFSGVIGSAIGATIAAIISKWFHLSPNSSWETWRVIWGGDIMAVLVLAPLVFAFLGRREKAPWSSFTWQRALEAVVVAAGLVCYSWNLLVNGGGVNSPKAPVMVFILWSGVRFGLRGGALTVFLFAILAAYLTTHYMTGVTPAQKVSGSFVFTLQLFVAVASVVGLVPAIVLGERDRTMARLRESEERFRTLTDAAFEGVVVSEDGRIVDINDQAVRMFGYECDEIIGKKIMDLVATESQTMVAEALRFEEKLIYGHKILRKDGRFFYAEAQARMVSANGRRLRMTAIRDITERKLAEQALRESEEKFSKAFRASPDGMGVTELETGKYIEVNDGYGRLYGYAREEMLGRTSVELGIWVDLQDRIRMVEMLKTSGTVREMEIRTRTRRGDIRIILFGAERIDLGGKACIVSVLHDVTDRIQAERALRASEESLRQTIENTPYVAVQWFDREGRVTFWNPASETMYGWRADEAMGKTLDELIFTREQATLFLEVLAQVERNKKPYGPVEFQFRRRDGRTGVILSTIFQIPVPCGEARYVCMAVDLTDRKEAEQASQSQRKVLEMIANGRPMQETLTALLQMVESQSPDMVCSILLLDSDGIHIRHGAAPSLPAEFVQAVDGMTIGPRTGSCGTAAYRAEAVYVSDIANDPLWADYKQLALPHSLLACWSTPIFDPQRKVLGTFAVYYRQTGIPTERHRQLISMTADTAAICINRHRAELEREESVAREQTARIEYTLQLIASQEGERKRIASELHDSMGQNLLLIKNLAHLAMQVASQAQVQDQLGSINQLATQCITEARRISRDLRPYQLDHLGLKRALEAMLEQAAQASQIQFTSKFEPVDDLFTADAEMNIYRVVQESLNNILKHSQANRVNILLERDIHEVHLSIEDDGVGFAPEKAVEKKGMGLRNINERARMLGGRLNLAAAPGQGTKIEVAIPIQEKVGAN